MDRILLNDRPLIACALFRPEITRISSRFTRATSGRATCDSSCMGSGRSRTTTDRCHSARADHSRSAAIAAASTTFYSRCSVVGELGGAVPVPEQLEP